SIHQNVKFLLDAVKIEESYKDLIKMLVCNVENSECMLRHCDNCLSDDALIEHLTAKLSEDYDLEEEIILSQWVNTDRTEMVKQSISVESCISLLSKSVENLIPHSYITKSQSKTFKKLKEDPPLNTAIVVMDFSENYSYTIQNEILSYHWNRGGCTIHPVGLYLKKNDGVFISNHCFISDNLQHDTSFVNYVQKEISEWLKENHPKINQVHYFTDGCTGQYKNRNSFKNLTNHHEDFGMKAEHSFFATSHGKSICDGLGGIVKRILRKPSLQLSDENQIKTSTAAYDFCKVNIEKNASEVQPGRAASARTREISDNIINDPGRASNDRTRDLGEIVKELGFEVSDESVTREAPDRTVASIDYSNIDIILEGVPPMSYFGQTLKPSKTPMEILGDIVGDVNMEKDESGIPPPFLLWKQRRVRSLARKRVKMLLLRAVNLSQF
ncbi:hypothetical protein QYM36_003252, partial [Artemia franciscana]